MKQRVGVIEHFAFRIARKVAGPDRKDWLDAIQAEAEFLPARRTEWALGALVAAVKDRFARAWMPAAAIVALVCAELGALAVLVITGHAVLGYAHMDTFWVLPFALALPVPFAFLAARVTPHRGFLTNGLIAYAIHQAIPPLVVLALYGITPYFGWGATIYYTPAHPWVSVVVGALPWLFGAWLAKRHRVAVASS